MPENDIVGYCHSMTEFTAEKKGPEEDLEIDPGLAVAVPPISKLKAELVVRLGLGGAIGADLPWGLNPKSLDSKPWKSFIVWISFGSYEEDSWYERNRENRIMGVMACKRRLREVSMGRSWGLWKEEQRGEEEDKERLWIRRDTERKIAIEFGFIENEREMDEDSSFDCYGPRNTVGLKTDEQRY
ncbi:hypothetical protein Ancab_000456 [Ancistrocladus abbreviatus]